GGASRRRSSGARFRVRPAPRPARLVLAQSEAQSALLAKPSGFEGLGIGAEGLPPDGLPLAPLADNPQPFLDRSVADRAVSAKAQKSDRQVTKIAHFEDLDGEVAQAGEQTLPPAADSSVAVI